MSVDLAKRLGIEPPKGLPEFSPGDIIRVMVKVKEEDKERLQAFEGTVISKKGSLGTGQFTVRRLSYGVGVERTFPFASPVIDKITMVKKGRVRRAKLYYLRDKIGKETRVKEELPVEAKPVPEPSPEKT